MVTRFRGDGLEPSERFNDGVLFADGGTRFDVRRPNADPPIWELSCNPQAIGACTLFDLLEIGRIDLALRRDSPLEGGPAREDGQYAAVSLYVSPERQRYPWLIVDVLSDGRALIEAGFGRMDDEDSIPGASKRAIERLLRTNGVDLHNMGPAGRFGDGFYWHVAGEILTSDVPIADSWAVMQRMNLIFRNPPSEVVDRTYVATTLRAGHPEVLLGITENEWLEVKSAVHDLDSARGRLELAKDVAQFANSPDGGLLAFGFRTDTVNSSDEIVKLAPLRISANVGPRILAILDSAIYPRISGITVETIVAEFGKFMLVEIPGQSDQAKPFVVEGAIIEGKIFESVFSIPQRRGEGIKPTRGREIQALLAGKLFYKNANGR